MDHRKSDPRKMTPKVGMGVDARDYKGIKQTPIKDSLTGKNNVQPMSHKGPDKNNLGGKHSK